MESRRMKLTLFSASDLNHKNILSNTKAYAIARISNDRKNKQKTRLGNGSGTAPVWNHDMKFMLNEADLQQGGLRLEIVIYTDATVGNKEIGRVCLPLNEFLRHAGGNKGATTSAKFVSYPVRTPSGKDKGVLNLSVKLATKPEVKRQQQQPQPVAAGSYGAGKSEPVAAYALGSYGAANAEPVTAYPAYPPPSSSSQPLPCPSPHNQYPPPQYSPQAGYPPPQPHYPGYPPPPYHGYLPNQGYPPYHGYVFPAAQQPPKKNSGLGMDLTAGFLARVLEDLLLRNIVSDSYNGGFDGGGFGDGGFDGDGSGGGGFDGGF